MSMRGRGRGDMPARGAAREGQGKRPAAAMGGDVPQRARKERKVMRQAEDKSFDQLVAQHKRSLLGSTAGLREWLE